MGADGGVAWFVLKKPEKLNRAYELIAPFNIVFHSDDHEEHDLFFKSNPDIKNTVWSFQGSFLNYGFEELSRILTFADFEHEDKWEYTFSELIDDFETLPSWEVKNGHWSRNTVENFIYTYLIEYRSFENIRKQIISIKDMKFIDWFTELKSYLGKYSYQETWT